MIPHTVIPHTMIPHTMIPHTIIPHTMIPHTIIPRVENEANKVYHIDRLWTYFLLFINTSVRIKQNTYAC